MSKYAINYNKIALEFLDNLDSYDELKTNISNIDKDEVLIEVFIILINVQRFYYINVVLKEMLKIFSGEK